MLKSRKKQVPDTAYIDGEYFERTYVGDLKLSLEYLRKHLLIVGATGSGKSVMIKRMIRDIIKRQKRFENPSVEDSEWVRLKKEVAGGYPEDQLWEKYKEKQMSLRAKNKMVVHDIKGDFTSQFYTKEGWIILNPFDKRGYGFEVIELISKTTDIDRVVSSIIPRPPDEKDPVWTNVPRSILKAIINLCLSRDEFLNSDILKYINMGYQKLIFEISEKEPYINDKGEEKFSRIPKLGMEEAYTALTSGDSQASIYWSSFSSSTKFFSSVPFTDRTINARDFIRNDPRNLILANFDEVSESNSILLALFVDSISSEILALKENDEYEIYLFLDEFNSLQKMPKILELLKLARSKGGIVVIGVQEIPPIEEKYGKAAISTIKNNTRTKIIFNINDDETQKMIVSMIGKHTMVYSTESNSGGETETKDGFSTSEQRQSKDAILNSSVGALQTHDFFFIQSGVTKDDKRYVGKITGMIDPELDFRENIAQSVIWNDDLVVKNVRAYVDKKKILNKAPKKEFVDMIREQRALHRAEISENEKKIIEELKKMRDAKEKSTLGTLIAAPVNEEKVNQKSSCSELEDLEKFFSLKFEDDKKEFNL